MTIWSQGFKVRSIKPLEPEDAMKRGAEFVGESFVFLVGGGVVVFEYSSSKQKEKKKEEARILQMKKENDDLERKLNALDARLKALEKVVVKNRMQLLQNAANNETAERSPTSEQISQRHKPGFWDFLWRR